MLVAVVRNRPAVDELHRKVQPPARVDTAVEDLRDIRMAHARQSLALGLEAPRNRDRIHTGLDPFDCYLTTHRLSLFAGVDDSHATLTEATQDAIMRNRFGIGEHLLDRDAVDLMLDRVGNRREIGVTVVEAQLQRDLLPDRLGNIFLGSKPGHAFVRRALEGLEEQLLHPQ